LIVCLRAGYSVELVASRAKQILGPALVIAGVVVALGVATGSAGTSPPPPKGLLLWNRLGSTYEVTHSAFGPKLRLFNCRAKRAPHFGPRCSIDIRGRLAFVDGPFSRAATIGG
jgi:hypothetical protein